ncbi:MAG: ABC transporter substrate-binding protein [Longimicrobiales bacterium]
MRSAVRSALVLATLAAGACTESGPRAASTGTVRVTDHYGQQVALAGPASRVVSLIPASTEMVLALGAADRLVARTDYDTWPALDALPSVGQGLTPSLEWLLALEPDLVIAWQDAQARSVVAQLRATGVAVYGVRLESVSEVERTIRDLGVLLGRASAADSVLAALSADLGRARAIAEHASRPRVLYPISLEPPYIAGPGSFVDELITIAGGENVFADLRSPWPQVSLEEILRRQPDVLVTAVIPEEDNQLERFRSLRGWRDLDAVRNGRVYVVDAELFNRPGPRLGHAAVQLARLLHPDTAAP